MKNHLLIVLFVALASCQSQQETDSTETTLITTEKTYPELLDKALDAHGSIEKWNSFSSLSYNLWKKGDDTTQMHLIDLKSRKTRVTDVKYTLGFDGKNVWVSPSMEAFGGNSARFYHNLYFYFFGIPFLLSDAGINYEDLGLKNIGTKSYHALKISYNEGIGDSDEDVYIAHFNPDNHQLEILLYTVTYYSGEVSEKYNALVYDQWQSVNGLLVPAHFFGRKFENGELGDVRYEASFKDVSFEEQSPDQSLFEIPAEAEIDSSFYKQ